MLANGVVALGEATITWEPFTGSSTARPGGEALTINPPTCTGFSKQQSELTVKYYQCFLSMQDGGGSGGTTLQPTGQADEEVVVRDGKLYYPPTEAGTYYYRCEVTDGTTTVKSDVKSLEVAQWKWSTVVSPDNKIRMMDEQDDPTTDNEAYILQDCSFAEGKQWECAGVYTCPDITTANTWSGYKYITLVLDRPVYAQLLLELCDKMGNDLVMVTSKPCYSAVHDYTLTANYSSRGVIVKSISLQLARKYDGPVAVKAHALAGVKYTGNETAREPGNLIDYEDDFSAPELDKKWGYENNGAIVNKMMNEWDNGALKCDVLEANKNDFYTQLVFKPEAKLSQGEEYEVTATMWAEPATTIQIKWQLDDGSKDYPNGGYQAIDLTPEPKTVTCYLTPTHEDGATSVRWQLAKAVSTIHFDDFSIRNRYPGARKASDVEKYEDKSWTKPLNTLGVKFQGNAGAYGDNKNKMSYDALTHTITFKESGAMCGQWFGDKEGEPVDWTDWGKLTVELNKAFKGSLTIQYENGTNDVIDVTATPEITVPITKAAKVVQYYLTIKTMTASPDDYVVKASYLTPLSPEEQKGGLEMFSFGFSEKERPVVYHYFNLINSGTGSVPAKMSPISVGGRTDAKHPDAGCLALSNPQAEEDYFKSQLALELPFVLRSTKDYELTFYAKRISEEAYTRLLEQDQAASEAGNKGLAPGASTGQSEAPTLRALSEDLQCIWQNPDSNPLVQGGWAKLNVDDDWTPCTFTIRIPTEKLGNVTKDYPSNSTRLCINFGKFPGYWLIDDIRLTGTSGTKTATWVRLHWYLPEEQKILIGDGDWQTEWTSLLCATAAAYPRAEGVSAVTYSYKDPTTGQLKALKATDKTTLPAVQHDTKLVVTAYSNGNSQYKKALPVTMEFWITKDGERHHDEQEGALSVVEGGVSAVVATSWYTLGGQPLAGPTRGLCVVREQHADGSTSSRLVRVRE